MTDQLNKCPFCKSNMKIGQEPQDNHPYNGMFYIYHEYGDIGSPARQCKIDIRGHFDTREEILSFWNIDKKMNATIGEMTTSKGEDFWVILHCENRELSIRNYDQKNRAQFECAEINWLINGGEKPCVLDYPDEI